MYSEWLSFASPSESQIGLLSGQGIQTPSPESAVTVRCPDTTSMDLSGETRVSQITNGTGKRIVLDFGTVIAQVARQPAGQPLLRPLRRPAGPPVPAKPLTGPYGASPRARSPTRAGPSS